MNLTDVYDRAYENAMRQGYAIDRDVLWACIEAAAHADPPFAPDRLEDILLYIKENPELLPTTANNASRWPRRWAAFFTAQDAWNRADQGRAADGPPPPLLCDYGL